MNNRVSRKKILGALSFITILVTATPICGMMKRAVTHATQLGTIVAQQAHSQTKKNGLKIITGIATATAVAAAQTKIVECSNS